MFTSRIIGGLGNQLFSYAVGYACAKRIGTNYGIDKYSGLKHDSFGRTYLLDNFNISGNEKNYYSVTGIVLIIAFSRKLNKLLPNKLKFHISEKELDNMMDIFSSNRNYYLDGYFQSYLYLEGYREELKNEFTLSIPLPDFLIKLNGEINKQNAVAIHYRSYDEVPSQNRSTGLSLNDDYYINAINYILKKVDRPVFYIFSDKIEKAKSVLSGGIKNTKFYYVEEFSDMEKGMLYDFELMKNAKHFIIANSTFSWWAAYLGQKEESIVIRPSEELFYTQNKHFYLPDWKTV